MKKLKKFNINCAGALTGDARHNFDLQGEAPFSHRFCQKVFFWVNPMFTRLAVTAFMNICEAERSECRATEEAFTLVR